MTVTAHEVLTAIIPALSETLLDPAVAVPPHVLVKAFGVAITTFVGRLSVNAIPCNATVLLLGLVIVMVNVLMPLGCMPLGLNPLAIVGGTTTV